MLSLQKVLHSARGDVIQAVPKTNSSVSDCLMNVGEVASIVDHDVYAMNSLVYLATSMKEASDEILVLEQLHFFLTRHKKYLPEWRKTINSEMSRCAEFAIVTVKGQAVLNTFSQLDEQFTSLLNRIERVLPPRTQ